MQQSLSKACRIRVPDSPEQAILKARNTKEGSITVPLTSGLTGLDLPVLQIKTKIVSCHTANAKPVRQEVNCTVILNPFSIPGLKALLSLQRR